MTLLNTLQHTATHCNTLQRTATHSNIRALQHTSRQKPHKNPTLLTFQLTRISHFFSPFFIATGTGEHRWQTATWRRSLFLWHTLTRVPKCHTNDAHSRMTQHSRTTHTRTRTRVLSAPYFQCIAYFNMWRDSFMCAM